MPSLMNERLSLPGFGALQADSLDSLEHEYSRPRLILIKPNRTWLRYVAVRCKDATLAGAARRSYGHF